MSDFKRIAIKNISVMQICSPKHRSQQVKGRDFHALSYRLDGVVELESGGKRIVSEPNSVTFTPKGMSYRTTIKEDTKMIVIHFRLVKDLDFQAPYILSFAGAEIKRLFELLAAKYLKGEENYFEYMAIFYQLLFELERYARQDTVICDQAQDVKTLIDASFGDPSLDVAYLADKTGVSDSYLRRIFKRSFGESPSEYITRIRIQNAKILLESEFLTVEEVAQRCGFNSLSYFIQSFRARTGETPGAYRKRKFRL